MNSRPALPDHLIDDPALTAEDLQAAQAVLRAFEPVVATAPAPAVPPLTPTTSPVRGAHPARADLAPVAAASAMRRERILAPLAVAATVAAVVTGAALLGQSPPPDPSSGVAALPTAESGDAQQALEAAARTTCTAALTDRGDREVRSLPATVADIRPYGTSALALYADARWAVTCALTRQDDTWRVTSIDLVAHTRSGSGQDDGRILGPSGIVISGGGHPSEVGPRLMRTLTLENGTEVFVAAGRTDPSIRFVGVLRKEDRPVAATLDDDVFAVSAPTGTSEPILVAGDRKSFDTFRSGAFPSSASRP